MTAYYLAGNGSDAAAGTFPSAAWATIARLNTALAANQIVGGDLILFRRGDTFYGSPTHSGHLAYPNTGWITYGAYGSGPKPRISCYKVATEAGWASVGNSVWRLDLAANSGAYTGATAVADTNVGHIRVDGVTHGVKRNSQAALSATWDFYSGDYAQTDTTGMLYVKSPTNPSANGRIVEIAVSARVFEVQRHRTRIQDLDIFGADGGIIGNAYWAPHDIEVTRCDVHDMGGAYIYGYGSITRGGNGVQCWIGNKDWAIHHNRIWSCYDVGVTYQGGQGVQVASNRSFERLHTYRNRIWNCCQSFEVWSQGTDGEGFIDCSFTDNLCFNAGDGWGQAVRPDPAGRGCHVLLYEMELPTDVLVARNVFYSSVTGHLFALNGVPPGFTLRDNTIYLPPGLPIQTSTIPAQQRSETVAQSVAFVAATGLEQGSTWFGDKADAAAHLASLGGRIGRIVPTTSGLRHLDPDVTWPSPDPA